MRFSIAAIIITLLLPVGAWAQTLGEATQEVRDRSEALIAQRLPQVDTWGEQVAVDDLRLVQESSAALLAALAGNDATAVKTFQQNLATAGRRIKTSQTLLPDPSADAATVAELESRIAAIDTRLTELRLRFDNKATLTTGPMTGIALSSDDQAFDIYGNANLLLIDVRDARRLCEMLSGAGYPNLGVGFGQPNNLDSLQLRRLVLDAYALENALQGGFGDITEVLPLWYKFRQEYDRLGYAGQNNVTRQLERVMDRLGLFFNDVAGDG